MTCYTQTKRNAENKLKGKYKQMVLCTGNGKEITDIREAGIEIHWGGCVEESVYMLDWK